MRVELTIDGGFAYFPGLAKPIVVEATQLPAAGAVELERLCAEALTAAGQPGTSPPATLPDQRRYCLTIHTDGAQHQFTAADPITPPAVADLIAFAISVARR